MPQQPDQPGPVPQRPIPQEKEKPPVRKPRPSDGWSDNDGDVGLPTPNEGEDF